VSAGSVCSTERSAGSGPNSAHTRRFVSRPSSVRSKALIRLPKVSTTSSTPSGVIALPLGNQRSSATSVTVPSGSTRCSEAVSIGAPDIRSKPKLPT
jgi:hypothetical protein